MSTHPARLPTAVRLIGALAAALLVAGIVTSKAALFDTGVVVGVVAVFMMLVDISRASAEEAAARRRLWTEGTPARARIVTLKATGSHLKKDPVVELDLEVLAPGQEPYRVPIRTVVSQLAIPRVQPECQLDVRVDPADPKRVAIDPALMP